MPAIKRTKKNIQKLPIPKTSVTSSPSLSPPFFFFPDSKPQFISSTESNPQSNKFTHNSRLSSAPVQQNSRAPVLLQSGAPAAPLNYVVAARDVSLFPRRRTVRCCSETRHEGSPFQSASSEPTTHFHSRFELLEGNA
ncbi:hypothetical protein AAHA92_29186 [Salvia divinorum]|uniref:Uncharacterized protein n=1 Tax=Salvia divinorum TaxID=28513 RepID=A0ABD1FXI3_SALDI